MKKIMFISYEYYPVTNGTITCIRNILKHLSQHYDVTVYCSNKKNGKINTIKDNGINIEFLSSNIDNVIRLKELLIHNILYSNSLNPYIRSAFLLIIKALFLPFTVISKKYGLYYETAFKNNSLELLISESFKYDYVISVGAPFINLEIVNEIINRNNIIKSVILQFDLYSNNPTLKIESKDSRIKTQMEWYSNFDKIILQPQMKCVIEKSPFEFFSDKLYYFTVPSFCEKINMISQLRLLPEHKTHIVYTGLFYENIRNPESALALLSVLCNINPNIYVHIVGYGCENILNDAKKKMKEHLILHGRVSKERAEQFLLSADILMNVSNSVSSQTPSKIMEYISTGKPIINFYSIENDVCKEYLEKYPCKMNIMTSCDIESVYEINRFVLKNKGKNCEYDDIKKKYYEYSPEKYTIKLMELMENIKHGND